MASWDTPAVPAPTVASYAAPLVNFDALANLPMNYYKGAEMARAQAKANAFADGIPRIGGGDTGPVDYNAMSEKMLRLGDFPTAATLQNTGIEMQRMRNGQGISNQYLSPAGPAGDPSGQPTAAPPPQARAAPAQNTPATGPRQPTIRQILQAQKIPNDQWDAAAGWLARQLGVPDDAQIDTNDPQVRNVLGPALGQLKRMGIGQVQPPQPGDNAPSPPQPPQAAPSQRISQGFADAGVPAHGVPDGSQAPSPAKVADTAKSLGMAPQYAAAFQSRLDAMPAGQRKALLEQWATDPSVPKSLNDFAEKRLESIERGEEPTNEQKNTEYDDENGGVLTRHEARLAGAKKAASAPYEIAEAAVREGGRPISIKPNEVVATGNQVNPALEGITNWAARRMGVSSGAPAAPAPPPSAPVGPPVVPGNPAPVAPNVAAPQDQPPGRSAFTPQMVRNPDGSVASTVTPSTETMQKTAAQNYEKAREAFGGAQEVQSQLTSMEDSFRKLNSSGWSSTGTGAEAKLQMAKAANSIWQTLGVKDQDLPFDPSTVSSWEKLTKDTTRLGFALARTLGAREAMQVVQGAINANPNVKNTPLGAKMVLNTIRQNAERQSDYFEYATKYAQTHGGDLIGAETGFAKLNPPTLYARRAIVQAQKDIPQEAIEQLRNDPSSAPSFDKHYGADGLAKMFLGNARLQGLQ